MMKKSGVQILFFIFMFILSLTACNRMAQMPTNAGLKSEISREAKTSYEEGLALAVKGEQKKAIDAYNQAIKLEPGYSEAYDACSKAYYALGNYDLARYYNMKSKDILESKATVIREMESANDVAGSE